MKRVVALAALRRRARARRGRSPRRGRVPRAPDVPPGARAVGRDPRAGGRRDVDRGVAAPLPAARVHRRRDRRARQRPRDRREHPRRERRARRAGRDDRARGAVHRRLHRRRTGGRPRSGRSSAASRPRAAARAARPRSDGPTAFVPGEADRPPRRPARRSSSGATVRAVGAVPGRERACSAPTHAFGFRTEDEPGATLLDAVRVRRSTVGRTVTAVATVAASVPQRLRGPAPAPRALHAGDAMSFEAPGSSCSGSSLVPLAALGYWLLLRRSHALRRAVHEPRGARGGRRPAARLAPPPARRAAPGLARGAVRRVRAADRDGAGAERAGERRARRRRLRLDAGRRREALAARRREAGDALVPRPRARQRSASVSSPSRTSRRSSSRRRSTATLLVAGDRPARPGLRHRDRRCARSRRRARADGDRRDRRGRARRHRSKVLKDEDGPLARVDPAALRRGPDARSPEPRPGRRARADRRHPRLHDRARHRRGHDPRRPARAGAGDPGAARPRDARGDRGVHRRRRRTTPRAPRRSRRSTTGLGSRVGRDRRPREVTAMFVAAGALLLAGAVGAALVGAPRLP